MGYKIPGTSGKTDQRQPTPLQFPTIPGQPGASAELIPGVQVSNPTVPTTDATTPTMPPSFPLKPIKAGKFLPPLPALTQPVERDLGIDDLLDQQVSMIKGLLDRQELERTARLRTDQERELRRISYAPSLRDLLGG